MCVMHALIEECRKSIPPLVEELAKMEQMLPERMARAIAEGHITVPVNPRRTHRVCAIGTGCRVKVNVNVGTSASRCNETLEVEKGLAAIESGADTIMDLSTGGDLVSMRRKILSLDVPVGTVPVYESVRRAGSAADVDTDLLFRVIREHCEQGVDFLTLHCGVNREALSALRADPRILSVVSRGGAFHAAMMTYRDEENPLFSEFDYLLEILKEYDVVASLGDGMRPGSVCDSRRLAKSVEYITLGRLAQRALAKGVQRFIEGPGHIPLDEIGYNVRMLKEVTDGAPLYLLGPLPTDIAAGYDHVAAAIGGALACMHGADFLCMVSPSEHLALPSTDDIVEGTRVTKIAAHIGNTLRVEGSRRRERAMADARRQLDWEKQFRLALFGDLARTIHGRDGMMDTCSMCGDLCAVRMVRELFDTRKTGENGRL